MFPLEFPWRILANERLKGSWVFDPFCGRGTTNFAARLSGLPSVGIDSSPVATAIAEAKLATTSVRAVIDCLTTILNEAPDPAAVPSEPFWRIAYSENTLGQICRVREELGRDCQTSARKVLRALMLGALHGPMCKGLPSYFSNQSPRTFAPKPAYALKFWRQRNLRPPVVDVLDLVRRRATRYLSPKLPKVRGIVLQQDSRSCIRTEMKGLFSWVITSPPYYGMRTYIPDQWLRMWFVGGKDKVDYESRTLDIQHSSPDYFSSQLKQVWLNAAAMSTTNARLICRFGGIHDRRNDCLEILKSSFRESGWRLTTIRGAGSAQNGRRQAAQFGLREKQDSRPEYDAYARRDN